MPNVLGPVIDGMLKDYFPKPMTVMDRDVNLSLVQVTVDIAHAVGLAAIAAEDVLVLGPDHRVVLTQPRLRVRPRTAVRLPWALVELVAGLRFRPRDWIEHDLTTILREVERLRVQVTSGQLTDSQLLAAVHSGIRLRDQVFTTRHAHFLSSFALKAVVTLVAHRLPGGASRYDHPTGDDFPTRRFRRDLMALAQRWNTADADAAALFELSSLMGEFIDRHGGKCESFVPLVSDTVWDVDPSSLGSVLPLLTEDSFQEPAQPASAARGIAGRMRELAAERDWVVYGYEQATRLIRDALLARGHELVEAAVLDAPADIFHLTLAEVQAAVAADDTDLHTLVSARRRSFTAVPDNGKQTSPPVREQLRGIGASPGTFEGRAAVIRSTAGFADFTPGDILVCEMTSPLWLPMLAAAAAVVTDRGGLLSHAAIVAREFGKPAVIGTESATTDLETGRTYLVDGGRGIVTATHTTNRPIPTGDEACGVPQAEKLL